MEQKTGVVTGVEGGSEGSGISRCAVVGQYSASEMAGKVGLLLWIVEGCGSWECKRAKKPFCAAAQRVTHDS